MFREISKKFAEPFAEFVSPTQAADEEVSKVESDKLTSEQEQLLTQTMEHATAALKLSSQDRSYDEHTAMRAMPALSDSTVE